MSRMTNIILPEANSIYKSGKETNKDECSSIRIFETFNRYFKKDIKLMIDVFVLAQ